MATQDPKVQDPKIKPRYQARGGAASANIGTGTYKVDGLMYPTDLMAPSNENQYGNSYVIFYINVHENSMMWDGDENKDQYVADAPKNYNSEVVGSNYSNTSLNVAAVGAAALAARKANIVGNVVSGATGVEMNRTTAANASTVAGGVGAAAAISMIGGAKSQYKRMKQCIALHTPTDMNVRYSVSWAEDDMAGASAIAEVVQGLGENAGKILAGAAAFGAAGAVVGGGAGAAIGAGGALAAGVGASAVKSSGGYLAGVALGTPGIGRLISKTSGVVANPKKEQLFKSVDFRSFSFSYSFFPRDQDEARSVQSIIKSFKLHMHPEFKKGTEQFLYLYPSEFDIVYYANGVENLNYHRHTSCVLTDMTVNYSPQGITSTFADGMPSQINITLTFRELATLTKETIMDGF